MEEEDRDHGGRSREVLPVPQVLEASGGAP